MHEFEVFQERRHCKQPIVAFAERTVISKSGETLSHYKWADPQFLNLAIGTAVVPGTINFFCPEHAVSRGVANAAFRKEGTQHEEFHVPL
jgi:hypothetical protein